MDAATSSPAALNRSYFAFSLDRFSRTSAADFERFGRDVFVSDRDVFVDEEFVESAMFESFQYRRIASVGSSNANSKSKDCSMYIFKVNPRVKSPFLV